MTVKRNEARVVFHGNFEYSCGSSNALLGYSEAGKSLGVDVRASADIGCVDDKVSRIVSVATVDWEADKHIFVYEGYQFLTNDQLILADGKIPQNKTILVDNDGKYSPPIFCKNDSNHNSLKEYLFWLFIFERLSCKILQPSLGESLTNGVESFIFYGINDQARTIEEVEKEYDLLYLGNNWHRWEDIKDLLLGISSIRRHVPKIGLIGNWWLSDFLEGYKEATWSDPALLEKQSVIVKSPPSYGQVEKTMSKGKMNPIFIRAILRKMKFVTPRMFETFLANTIPLLPDYFDYAIDLYGSEVMPLIMSNGVNNTVMSILDNYEQIQRLCQSIREKLIREHSYKIKLEQLLEMSL
ncbi:hypothetical protein KKA15_04455 [Patescibacteria group bacterium]|nr:hypothetical protein [Patescibacteria group bacterium]